MKPYLLYIDIASIVNDADRTMEMNTVRKQQFIVGLKRLFEYDFKSRNCDIILTDNTCTELYPEIIELLPKDTVCRLFNDNRFGSINKGAGLIQKWLYNKELLQEYEWVIHFEGRLLLRSFSFFDRFFENPATYFTYGSKTPGDHSHFFTGLFSAQTKDVLQFCTLYPIDKLIQNSISIEYPISEFLRKKVVVLPSVDVLWFCARSEPVEY